MYPSSLTELSVAPGSEKDREQDDRRGDVEQNGQDRDGPPLAEHCWAHASGRNVFCFHYFVRYASLFVIIFFWFHN